MTVTRYKVSLNNARFPFVSTWGSRAVVVPSADSSGRQPRQYQGSDENIEFDLAQVLYGENFVPVAGGLKSVSFSRIINPSVNDDFDQIFPLRDQFENTVLYSPSKGQNYTYDKVAGAWLQDPLTAQWAAETPNLYLAPDSRKTPETAKVTRAYVDGKSFVVYEELGLTPDPLANRSVEGSIYAWDPISKEIQRVKIGDPAAIIVNLPIPVGTVGGVASSNGYLIFWSELTVYWAPFNGTAFDFQLYANGEVTGAGYQIPEDVQGLITSIVPVAGGFIIFTTKNAVAAVYNANNFASPWIFKLVSNAGGVEGYEQVTVEGNLGALYAYTTGGMQRISLNSAEDEFPDVTDFFGGRYIERFNTGDYTFEGGQTSAEFFVKVTYCGQRFLVLSYGTYPGIYSFALIYDVGLKRWGKIRLVHRDAFSYSYGTQDAPLTYSMLGDVSYDQMASDSYDDSVIPGGALTYPRQAIAFLLASGEVKLGVLDYRDPEDDSEAFVLIGKNQLSRARLSTLHEVEIEGLKAGGTVVDLRSITGATLEAGDAGYLREQDGIYSEWGFDMPTGKNHTLFIKGDFALTTVILHATNDGSY